MKSRNLIFVVPDAWSDSAFERAFLADTGITETVDFTVETERDESGDVEIEVKSSDGVFSESFGFRGNATVYRCTSTLPLAVLDAQDWCKDTIALVGPAALTMVRDVVAIGRVAPN